MHISPDDHFQPLAEGELPKRGPPWSSCDNANLSCVYPTLANCFLPGTRRTSLNGSKVSDWLDRRSDELGEAPRLQLAGRDGKEQGIGR